MRKHSSEKTTINNPLGDHSERFVRQLEGQHYAPATLREYGRCLRALAALMREQRIKMTSLDEADAKRLPEDCGVGRRRYATFIFKQFIRYLIDAGAVPAPEAYRDDSPLGRLRLDYLRVQRGLSERSIYHCWRFADRFLVFRFNGKPIEWSRVTALDVVRFMQSLAARRRNQLEPGKYALSSKHFTSRK